MMATEPLSHHVDGEIDHGRARHDGHEAVVSQEASHQEAGEKAYTRDRHDKDPALPRDTSSEAVAGLNAFHIKNLPRRYRQAMTFRPCLPFAYPNIEREQASEAPNRMDASRLRDLVAL
jgi:hypothetical protein